MRRNVCIADSITDDILFINRRRVDSPDEGQEFAGIRGGK